MSDSIAMIKSNATCGTLAPNEDLASFLSANIAKIGTELWALAHLENKVFFERIGDGTLPQSISGISKPALKELRVFGENGELHLWNASGRIGWRLRLDGPGDETEVSDKKQILWGNKIKDGDPCTLREDGRGCEIRMPIPISKDQIPLSLTIRNYIAFDEDGLLYFNDARIFSINTQNGGAV